MNKIFNWLMVLPFKILFKMAIGLTRLSISKPIEILLFLVCLVVLYASFATKEYNISLISGSLLTVYLLIKGEMK